MVPLNRSFLSSYRLSIVTVPLSVNNANFDWRFRSSIQYPNLDPSPV